MRKFIRIIPVVMMISLLSMCCAQLFARQRFVLSFKVNEFIPKGESLQVLNACIQKIKLENSNPKLKPSITIYSFTEKTGVEFKNDLLCLQRSENVVAPMAKALNLKPEDFKVINLGSTGDRREVWIEHEFIPIANQTSKMPFIVAGFGIFLAACILIGAKTIKKPPEKIVLERRFGNPVKVKFNNQWYEFLPLLNKAGVPEALHSVLKQGEPCFLSFSNQKDLAESVAKSLKNNPELMKQLEAEKRWKLLLNQPSEVRS